MDYRRMGKKKRRKKKGKGEKLEERIHCKLYFYFPPPGGHRNWNYLLLHFPILLKECIFLKIC
jgi:hypothetical protein